MRYECVTLREAALTAYIPDNSPEIDPARLRPAVLICPGGGYFFTSDREAEPIAIQLMAKDVCAFVLRYSVAPARYPTALLQAASAMAWIRENAARLFVDPGRVAIMGFSAGGHLAASVGVRWDEPWMAETLDKDPALLRPDGMILAYPVITCGSMTHSGSMENLLGTTDREAWKGQDLDALVHDTTPPAFLWHTWDDAVVPVENSLCFFTALRRHGIPAEYHVYPTGRHGLALGTAVTADPATRPEMIEPSVTEWLPNAVRWLRKL